MPFKGVSRSFKGLLKALHKPRDSLLKGFQGTSKGLSKAFKLKAFEQIVRGLLEGFESLLEALQKICFKSLQEVFKLFFKGFLKASSEKHFEGH